MKSLYWDKNKIELYTKKKKIFSHKISTQTKTFMFYSISKILISYYSTGQVICTIAPAVEIFDKTELENPSQLEEMLIFLHSIEAELPFEVILEVGEGNITKRFGNPK